MKKLLFVFLILSLVFFIVPQSPRPEVYTEGGRDGYTYHGQEFNKNKVTVNIITYKTRSELRKDATKVGETNPRLAAWTDIHPPYNECTIHMLDPAVNYEPEIFGHELVHCMRGQFHKNNDSLGN